MTLGDRWAALARLGPRGALGWLGYSALAGLSLGYRLGVAGHRGLYAIGLRRPTRAPIPVISIGNLTLGGTGKTVFAAMLAEMLLDMGETPAVLLRGYGRGAMVHGDEYVVLRARLPETVPVIEGRNRAHSARRAAKMGATVAILDDGHQHERVVKNLRVLLFDATRPEDLRAVFPAGMLREPLRGVTAADLVCLTRADQASGEQAVAVLTRVRDGGYDGPILRAAHEPRAVVDARTGEEAPLDSLQRLRCLVVSGIGNNAAFLRTVRDLGANVVTHLQCGDHHAYTQSDGERIAGLCRAHADSSVLTTAKDAPRLRPVLRSVDLRILDVSLRLLEGHEALHSALVRTLRPVRPGGGR